MINTVKRLNELKKLEYDVTGRDKCGMKKKGQ